jgi:hypothetical protein
MPGLVKTVTAKVGQMVPEGQEVCVIGSSYLFEFLFFLLHHSVRIQLTLSEFNSLCQINSLCQNLTHSVRF